jgi:hypothetical protein
MPRRPIATLLRLAALLAPTAPAAAGENANLAAADLLHTAAAAICETLQARYPDDYAALLPDAAGLAMLPGVGATAATTQAQAAALIMQAVGHVEQRDAGLVLRAPTASLRPVIAADRDLMQAAAAADAPFCAVLLEGQETAFPTGPLAAAYDGRTAALLRAIADGRDHPVTARRANPDDYQAFTQNAQHAGVDIAGWSVLAPGNLFAADPAQVCTAMISVDATVLALPDPLGDRILADMAAVLTHQGN